MAPGSPGPAAPPAHSASPEHRPRDELPRSRAGRRRGLWVGLPHALSGGSDEGGWPHPCGIHMCVLRPAWTRGRPTAEAGSLLPPALCPGRLWPPRGKSRASTCPLMPRTPRGGPRKQHEKTPTRQGTSLPPAPRPRPRWPRPRLSRTPWPGTGARLASTAQAGSSASGPAASRRVQLILDRGQPRPRRPLAFCPQQWLLSLAPAPSITPPSQRHGPASQSRSVLPEAPDRAGKSRRCPRPQSARQGRCPVSPRACRQAGRGGVRQEAPSHRAVRAQRSWTFWSFKGK